MAQAPVLSAEAVRAAARGARFSLVGLARPEDGFLTMGDVFDLKINANLVVLSPCQTALGENIAGEGIVGLSRAFLHAGASSVLVSLWPVNDERPALMEQYTARLERQWEAHRLLARSFTPGSRMELTPEQLETLRSLGYIR